VPDERLLVDPYRSVSVKGPGVVGVHVTTRAWPAGTLVPDDGVRMGLGESATAAPITAAKVNKRLSRRIVVEVFRKYVWKLLR
jgi:hypothetical protein